MWNRTIQSMTNPPEQTFSAMALSVSFFYRHFSRSMYIITMLNRLHAVNFMRGYRRGVAGFTRVRKPCPFSPVFIEV